MLYWKYFCFKPEQFTDFVLSIFAGIIKPLNANTNPPNERYIRFVFIDFFIQKHQSKKIRLVQVTS